MPSATSGIYSAFATLFNILQKDAPCFWNKMRCHWRSCLVRTCPKLLSLQRFGCFDEQHCVSRWAGTFLCITMYKDMAMAMMMMTTC